MVETSGLVDSRISRQPSRAERRYRAVASGDFQEALLTLGVGRELAVFRLEIVFIDTLDREVHLGSHADVVPYH